MARAMALALAWAPACTVADPLPGFAHRTYTTLSATDRDIDALLREEDHAEAVPA